MKYVIANIVVFVMHFSNVISSRCNSAIKGTGKERLFVYSGKVGITMARYTTPDEHLAGAEETRGIANPLPLGLCVLAFTTAILGAYYASFIIPYQTTGSRMAVGAIIFIGGIVQMLAGMWEFRRNNTIAATVFTSYGGFLAALGLVFLPIINITALLGGATHLALGLFFLCWTILSLVLLLGSMRTNRLFISILGLLFVSYLFLTVGQLAVDNRVLLVIGGWLGIICALVAWYAAIVSMAGTTNLQEGFHLPTR
jgi:succinate-acetate transporter protein